MRANGRAVKKKKPIVSRLRSSFHEVGRAHFWKLCSSKSASLLPLFVVRNLLPLFVVSSTWKEKLRASDAFHTITVRDIPSSTTWHTTGYHLRVRARSAPLLIGKWVFYDKDQFTIKEKRKEERKEIPREFPHRHADDRRSFSLDMPSWHFDWVLFRFHV